MRNRIVSTTLLIFIITLQCKNPFLPPIGLPDMQTSPRSTPQGLLDQLIDAYESRSIELFVDLLPKDGTFRFFVAPDFFSEYNAKYRQLSEPRDTRLMFIGQSDYYLYWTQDDEIERHKRLFSNATDIDFKEKPAIESVREFVDKGDSLAELKLIGGVLEVSRFKELYTVEIFIVQISEQVFLIKKEADGLWVIIKWYDFSTGAG